MTLVSYPARLAALAEAGPDRPAVTCGDKTLTRSELEAAADLLAADIEARGVGLGDYVTIALPNSVDWIVTAVACWKLGAVPQPVSAKLPHREVEAIIELAQSTLVVGLEPGKIDGIECLPQGHVPDPDLMIPERDDPVSPAWKAPTSGGSTGRPKLIVSGEKALIDPEVHSTLGYVDGGCLVMPAPLYHNGPVVWSCQALLAGTHVVLLPRFDSEATLSAVETHRGDVLYMVPTMMKRISALSGDARESYDLSSLRIVWHLAEPCPAWLKEKWIEWLGPDRILELYAGTEAQAVTVISGTEWLEHRGSVGRVTAGEMQVCDAEGNVVGPGEEGEVWMRSGREAPTYTYVGSEPRERDGGWESLGDMGWMDADGYLYLGDRMADMILTGGANVYPAEVESALLEHPAVRSAIVIGLPDDDKGNRVHAIVEADDAEIGETELVTFAAERLARYKLPRSVEYVDRALRDDAGKVRRAALRAERIAGEKTPSVLDDDGADHP